MSYLKEIKTKSISSMKWQTFNALFTSILNPIFIIFLTNLFTPHDFGIIAILMMIVSFAQKLTNLGFSQAIIQNENIEDEDLNTIFMFIIFMGGFLVIILNMSTELIAEIYSEESLVHLIKYTSVIFFIQPIGSIYLSILKKDLNYNLLTKINLIEFIIQKSVILILAYLGLGVVSYPLGMILGISIGNFILFFIFVKNNIWIPKFKFSLKRFKKFYKFGIFLTGQSLMNNLFYYIDEIIIAALFTPEVLGIYYFAKNIFNNLIKLVDRTISQVLYPIFCKIQNHNKAFYNLAIKLIKTISAIILPISLGISLTSSFFIPIFFGDEWLSSVNMISLMSIWAVFYLSTNVLMGPLFAKGKTDWVFYISVIEFPLRTIFLYLSGGYGITFFIITLTFLQIAKFIMFLSLLKRLIGLNIRTVIKEIKYIYIISLSTFLITWMIKTYLLDTINEFTSFLVIVLLFIIIYSVCIFLFDKKTTNFFSEFLPKERTRKFFSS